MRKQQKPLTHFHVHGIAIMCTLLKLSFISELKDDMNDMKKGVTLIPSSSHLKQSIFYPIVYMALSLFMFCFLVSENIIILLLPGSKTFYFPVI